VLAQSLSGIIGRLCSKLATMRNKIKTSPVTFNQKQERKNRVASHHLIDL